MINKLRRLHGDKPGHFHIAQCPFWIPLWAEKYWLRNIRSKRMRIRKKVMKREVMLAIRRGIDMMKFEENNFGATPKKNQRSDNE